MADAHALKPTAAVSDGSAFLQPQSMITPGVAGGLTMMITNALCYSFPLLHLRGTALIISGMLAAVVLAHAAPLWQRILYYVLNTLIVFSMSLGAGRLTVDPANTAALPRTAMISFISSAHAQEPSDMRYVNALQQIFANGNMSDAQRANALAELNARAMAEGWFIPGGAPIQPQTQARGFFQLQ
jgi:hypothetical protein